MQRTGESLEINPKDDNNHESRVIYLSHEIGHRQCVVHFDGCALPLPDHALLRRDDETGIVRAPRLPGLRREKLP
jgi:hypothetical protein